MKIAVPTNGNKGLEDHVGEHFGRAPTFTIVDDESGDVTILANTSDHMGGSGHPPELLAGANVDVLFCRGLGRRAIQLFNENEIKVFCDASGTVADAMKQWKNGDLVRASEDTACTQHAFRSHEHKEGCGKHK